MIHERAWTSVWPSIKRKINIFKKSNANNKVRVVGRHGKTGCFCPPEGNNSRLWIFKFMYPYLTPWEIHEELDFPPTPFTSLLGEHWGLHIHTLYLTPGGGGGGGWVVRLWLMNCSFQMLVHFVWFRVNWI